MLRLRNLVRDDLARVMTWRMSPEITKYMYTDPQITVVDQLDWFTRLSTSMRDAAWVIELDGSVPVGLLSLSDIDMIHRRCSWAYYLAEPAGRGRGLARALECNVCDFVFLELSLEKLCCQVLAFNDRVVALHEKFGSRVEGILRQHIRKGDAVHDVVQMGLLRDEWMERRVTLSYPRIAIDVPETLRP